MIKVVVNGEQDNVLFNNVVGYVEKLYKEPQNYYIVNFLEGDTPIDIYDELSPKMGIIKGKKFRTWCILPKILRKYINIRRIK